METSTHTIVAGVRSIEGPDPILAPALAIARSLGAELHLVHAFDFPLTTDAVGWPGFPASDAAAEYGRWARERLQEEVKRAGPGPVQVCVAQGTADGEVLGVAEALGARLVLVGGSRRGGMSRAFLGTVAERVVRGAGAPVFVMRAPLQSPPRRVLVASDFSSLSARAHEHGLDLVEAISGTALPEIRVLRVLGHVPGSWEEERRSHREARAEMEAYLAELRPRRVHPESHVRIGPPSMEILAEADSWAADLLIMGTHGRAGLQHLLLGSVAEAVLRRARCSVLVVPAPRGATAVRTPLEHARMVPA